MRWTFFQFVFQGHNQYFYVRNNCCPVRCVVVLFNSPCMWLYCFFAHLFSVWFALAWGEGIEFGGTQALYVSRFRSHVAAALTYRYFLLCKFILVSYLPRSTSDRCRWCHADNANAVPYSRKKANMCQEKCVYFIFIFISLDESRNSDNNGTEALWQQLNGEKKNWKKGNNE